jgi:ankyrin repeat protein
MDQNFIFRSLTKGWLCMGLIFAGVSSGCRTETDPAHMAVGASPSSTAPADGSNKSPDERLLEAAADGNVNLARNALQQGAKVDVRNDHGWTALIIALKAGKVECARLLLEKGADPNAQSASATGSTVLCFAADLNNPNLLAALVAKGGDVNGKGRNLVAPLYHAAAYGKLEAAKFLVTHGAKIDEPGFENERGERFTPLAAAASGGYLEMMKLLLEHGANKDATNNRGDSIVMHVSKLPQSAALKFLIDKGANVNTTGPKGHTALIYAAYNGQVENIKLLLVAGADPNATATGGDSPDSARYDAVYQAVVQEHPEAAELILQAQRRTGTLGTNR